MASGTLVLEGTSGTGVQRMTTLIKPGGAPPLAALTRKQAVELVSTDVSLTSQMVCPWCTVEVAGHELDHVKVSLEFQLTLVYLSLWYVEVGTPSSMEGSAIAIACIWFWFG